MAPADDVSRWLRPRLARSAATSDKVPADHDFWPVSAPGPSDPPLHSINDGEREKLLTGLAAIDVAVQRMVEVVDGLNGWTRRP